eukprot:SAG22_NODE_5212_length_1061_cov_0.669439_2_plen_144_part_01
MGWLASSKTSRSRRRCLSSKSTSVVADLVSMENIDRSDVVDQLAETADGQPANLLHHKDILDRRAIATRKRELNETMQMEMAVGNGMSAMFITAQDELAEIEKAEKAGPRVILFLGHLHAGQNMCQTMHNVYKLGFFAKASRIS